MFSGLCYIRPTSQAPPCRIGRVEKLYASWISRSLCCPRGFRSAPSWLTAMRHMLTDLTCNTHRSEFCIDKLYSLGLSTGRLGS
ncbi:MAG: transglutaminase family protein [Hahellaceae bacterium]|nr:transglutaminase family protein [Hahellaceae bacterium]